MSGSEGGREGGMSSRLKVARCRGEGGEAHWGWEEVDSGVCPMTRSLRVYGVLSP